MTVGLSIFPVKAESKQWLEIAKRVLAADYSGLKCPVSGDDLRVLWTAIDDQRGEFRIWCPACGAENFVRAAAKPDGAGGRP
jgi:hypothetical protein